MKSLGHFYKIVSLTEGNENPHELLKCLFKHHIKFDGINNGSVKSLNKFQLVFINSIQKIYEYQGVNINHKHIELIAKSITSRSLIIDKGNSHEFPTDFEYSNKISFIFSDWPLRFQNTEFRAYLKSIIKEHIPAHFNYDLFYLNVNQMSLFEELIEDKEGDKKIIKFHTYKFTKLLPIFVPNFHLLIQHL